MVGLSRLVGLPPQNMSIEETIEMFSISFGAPVVTMFYMVGLGSVALSALLPIVYIVKLEPKKVLM